jgi:glycosyltransferase involved in cell wall biosynthesis
MARVLLVTNLYAPSERGGYEILAREVCEQLVARGHELAVLTADGARPASASYDVWPDLELTAPFSRPDDRSRRRRAWVHRRNSRATRAAIARHRADAVLFFSLRRLTLGPARAVEGEAVARLFVINDAWPLAYRPRPEAAGWRPGIGRWLDHAVFSTTTTLRTRLAPAFVLSQSLRDELARGGLELADVAVSYQGVSTERFCPQPRQASDGATRLLFAGQLHVYKGAHDLVEAARLLERWLPAETFSVTIAGKGDPEYVRELHARARALRCRVELVGHVAFDRMAALYRRHDVLVFPSVWNEPLGLTHLEAMSCAVPAVVARSGGCGELIERCPHLHSYEPGDVEMLARVLRRLIQSPGLRQGLGQASRAWVTRHASLATYAGRIEAALGIRARTATSADMTPT